MTIDFEMLQGFVMFCIAIFAAIATVWGGVKAIREALKPLTDLSKRMDETDSKLDKDNKRIKDLEESNRLLLKAINQLISYELNGDSQDENLRNVQKEIHDYLINR